MPSKRVRSRVLRVFSICALLAVPACGGSSSADDDPTPDAGNPPLLEPPPPGQGFQLTMTTTLDPGVEREHCMFVKGPAQTYYINRGETKFTGASHHVLLYETPYTEIPTQKEDGTPVDTSGVFDCTDGATNGWRVTRVIGGSQDGDGESAVKFPPGVAMKVEGGRVLMINAHYINVSEQVAEPEVALNVWTIPESEVTDLGDVLFLYNPFIRVRGMSSETARWQCPVHSDINIVNVQSHMHARGVGYSAAIKGQEPFYINDQWESVPVGEFDPPLHVSAGSVFDYHCSYTNPEMRDVYQGPRTTDEMCMLIGSYYPVDRNTANCRDATGQFYGGVWVGQGSANCNTSWSCITDAASGNRAVQDATDCIMASDPAIAPQLSAALACAIGADDPLNDCTTQIQTCQSM